MIKTKLQEALDQALYPLGIYSYDQVRTGPDADVYVVYSQTSDTKEFYADDKDVVRNAHLSVRIYYREDYLADYDKKLEIRDIEKLIEDTLEEHGFDCPYGKFDAGDVDDIGYFTTVWEVEYWRLK